MFDRLGISFDVQEDLPSHIDPTSQEEVRLITAFTVFVFDRNYRFVRQDKNTNISVARK